MSTGKIVLAYAEKLSESNTHHNADNEKIKQSRTHIRGYGGFRASSVHDHFGAYHFGTGFSPNSKFGPLRYMQGASTTSVHVSGVPHRYSVYTTSVH